jgi:hypothetical protein
MTVKDPSFPSFNPYQAPHAPLDAHHAGVQRGEGQATQLTIEHLRGTSPWVLFLSILGFIIAGFSVLGGLGTMIMVPIAMTTAPSSGDQTGMAAGMGIIVATGLFYLVMGVAYGVGSYFLVKYTQSIGRLVASGLVSDVEEALAAQRMFWKSAGIITIGLIGAGILMFIAMMVFAIAMGATQS